ncbi:DnaJ-domain-containing protein [Fragilariopsis cylindrus CCMP1102]|uniref:DnaJ-domain-containing protein n=1 Tax=Fragilariopsis cylindrus CCMP1102 TaxID=635003 RepID=A0A1E7FW12_9STRA|nr:DnaJ-domain-containing protein [Fragilariopsis cylindrus CCMP1102]|eukprot:OEU22349.1 DnaJ-domain-containing protein [Fragilariopsis cylindrus CCMP1102]
MEFYRILKSAGDEEKVWATQLAKDEVDVTQDGEESSNDDDKNTSASTVDLFSLSEIDLKEIDYYTVLSLACRPTITPDDVKKAYRKACLKYHPDKSGRGEEDAVFLKVKTAFETLTTQKKAYDSTEMPFDESIPSDKTKSTVDFFELWEPVFQRNLHFDSRLGGSSRNLKNNKNKQGPPSLGDDSTPVEEVHEYYEYWIHFESWRDFSLQAARELETQEHLDNAESRYEKRWFQKEIDRAAKKLKAQEVSRMTLLVERAMAADPRLIQERKRLIDEKGRKQRERIQEALDKKQKEEDAIVAEQNRVEDEKKQKAEEKVLREKGKKLLRKAKQAFKRHVSAALEKLELKEYALEDEVDLICIELNHLKLTKFNSQLDSKAATEVVAIVKTRVKNIQDGVEEDDAEDEQPEPSSVASNGSDSKTILPFTKEEMSALSKGVKKFPAGGGNRWDQISHYINNVCRPDDPRTKEECIEIFNKVNKAGKQLPNGNTSHAVDDSDVWNSEQDQQLQKGLTMFPSSIEKNERWSSISDEVTGKSKKECVERFKAIRDALKAKK